MIPRILQLADDLPGVSVALLLHAPNQGARQLLLGTAGNVRHADNTGQVLAIFWEVRCVSIFVGSYVV